MALQLRWPKRLLSVQNFDIGISYTKVHTGGSPEVLTCVKVLACIVETCICRITLSMRGLGPVRKPTLNLGKKQQLLPQKIGFH